MPFLDIEGRELKLAALAFSRADAETKKDMRKVTASLAPTLQRAVAANAVHPIQRRVAASARLRTNRKGLVAVFGSAGRLDDGTPLRRVVGPFEFGDSTPNDYTRYLTRHRISGRSYLVNRRAERQLPARRKDGYTIYPAVAQVTPSLVSQWVRVIAQAVQV